MPLRKRGLILENEVLFEKGRTYLEDFWED